VKTTLPMTEEDILRRAKRRVGLKTGFSIHALVYVLVNLGLAAINLYNGGQRWHYFPLLGWGLGLAIHGIVTFLALRGEGYRQRMLAQEVARVRDGR
jgi:hypothetical protein